MEEGLFYPSNKTDIFDGVSFNKHQERLFDSPLDISLSLFVDAFKPFKRTKISLTIVHLIILNLPREIRYLESNMIQVAILPCNPKKAALHHLLSPLIKELKQLESSGMHIVGSDGAEFTVKAHLLIASGDIVGVTDLCNHSGHSSIFGCRICPIETTCLLSPKGKGYGRYFLGPNLLPKNRKAKDFKDGDP
ncbi:hypothetical protein INT45_005493, partial [Circinella minor]